MIDERERWFVHRQHVVATRRFVARIIGIQIVLVECGVNAVMMVMMMIINIIIIINVIMMIDTMMMMMLLMKLMLMSLLIISVSIVRRRHRFCVRLCLGIIVESRKCRYGRQYIGRSCDGIRRHGQHHRRVHHGDGGDGSGVGMIMLDRAAAYGTLLIHHAGNGRCIGHSIMIHIVGEELIHARMLHHHHLRIVHERWERI